MLVAWLVGSAVGAPPDSLLQLKEIDSARGGQVERMKSSVYGDVVVGRTQGDLQGWLYDLDGWELFRFDDCDVTGVAPVDAGDGSDLQSDPLEIWVSCADGSIRVKTWNGETVGDRTDEDGTPVVLDVDPDSLSDLWFDSDFSRLVYAISVGGEGTARVHVVDPFDDQLDAIDQALGIEWPKPLGFQGYIEGTIVQGSLVVTHGGQGISTQALGLGPAVASSVITAVSDCDDLAPTPQNTVYCVDRQRNLVSEFFPPNSPPVGFLFELNGPEAVGASLDPEDGWIAVTGNQVTVWEVDQNGGLVEPPAFQGGINAEKPHQ